MRVRGALLTEIGDHSIALGRNLVKIPLHPDWNLVCCPSRVCANGRKSHDDVDTSGWVRAVAGQAYDQAKEREFLASLREARGLVGSMEKPSPRHMMGQRPYDGRSLSLAVSPRVHGHALHLWHSRHSSAIPARPDSRMSTIYCLSGVNRPVTGTSPSGIASASLQVLLFQASLCAVGWDAYCAPQAVIHDDV